jgi:hypothetical protein
VFWDTEKDHKVEINRTNEMVESFLDDFKVDPNNVNIMYIAVNGIDSQGIIKLNVQDGKWQTSSYLKDTNFTANYIRINESCTHYNIAHNAASDDGMKINSRIKIVGINESPKLTFDDSNKDYELMNPSTLCKVNDDNYVYYYNNDRNQPCMQVKGQVKFDRSGESLGDNVVPSDIKDFGFVNNSDAIFLYHFRGTSFNVCYMPADKSSPVRSYLVEETTFMKFNYPTILLCKGGKEIILFDVTENLYYYVRLNIPIVFNSSSYYTQYGNDYRFFVDLGDYLAYTTYSFGIGANPYMSGTIYKKYLEKSTFPDSPLIAGFEAMQVNFKMKDEEAYTLQFENSIYNLGALTHSLIQITESDLVKGELIQISYEGFMIWKKGSKTITYKTKPINFADNTSGDSLFESQDYLQSVKCEANSEDYLYHFFICDEARFLKHLFFDTAKEKRVLTMKKEYFVHEYFTGATNFVFTDQMVYQGFAAYLCVEKGTENQEFNMY